VEIDLSDNAFGPAGAKPLMRLLINNRNIEILRLNNNGLGIEGARLISEALVEAHEKNVREGIPDKLQVIVAGRNRMESPGVGHLSKALEAFSASLKHIQMPQNSIRPEGNGY
jgi:Ran GTPase-activating protein 1